MAHQPARSVCRAKHGLCFLVALTTLELCGSARKMASCIHGPTLATFGNISKDLSGVKIPRPLSSRYWIIRASTTTNFCGSGSKMQTDVCHRVARQFRRGGIGDRAAKESATWRSSGTLLQWAARRPAPLTSAGSPRRPAVRTVPGSCTPAPRTAIPSAAAPASTSPAPRC